MVMLWRNVTAGDSTMLGKEKLFQGSFDKKKNFFIEKFYLLHFQLCSSYLF
jgi:hypothetical protein